MRVVVKARVRRWEFDAHVKGIPQGLAPFGPRSWPPVRMRSLTLVVTAPMDRVDGIRSGDRCEVETWDRFRSVDRGTFYVPLRETRLSGFPCDTEIPVGYARMTMVSVGRFETVRRVDDEYDAEIRSDFVPDFLALIPGNHERARVIHGV